MMRLATSDSAPDTAEPTEPADAPRDAGAIDASNWLYRLGKTTGGDRPAGFATIFAQSALDEIHMHGQSAATIEVCGVLVGGCYRDDAGPYLFVEHVVRGTAAASRSTNVTFTAETWQHIQSEMDAKYADKKIVGWYHTHPSFGIFLSEMDIFICENFFNLPWQSAFVYDPQGGDEGNFIWRAGKPTREPFFIEDDVTPKAAAVPLISVSDAMAGPGSSGLQPAVAQEKIVQLLARVRRLENRQRLLVVAVCFLAAFMMTVQLSPLGPPWMRQLMPPAAPTPVPAAPHAQEPSGAQPHAPVSDQPASPPAAAPMPQVIHQ